jgi:ArsR family transcriptional regulator
MLHVFKALADESRLRIVAVLAQGDFNVNELIEILRMGQSRISRHLKILADGGIVANRREGNWIYYSLAPLQEQSDLAEIVRIAVQSLKAAKVYEKDLQHLESLVQRRRSMSQKYFDRVGPEWECLQREVLDSTSYREHALAYLPEGKDSVVDLGAGAGLLLPSLLGRFKTVIALDSSQTMLKVAADYVQKQLPTAASRCEFRLGELEHLPIHDRTVDAAIASMVLHHVSNPGNAIAEVYRVLKRGGAFVLADLLEHNIAEMREKYADLWLGFKKSDLNKWLVAAGFAVQKTEVLDKHKTMKVLLIQATKN